ncbi:GNAT family N-acetyltransferase [Marinicauda salina]|uniref:GNAT family N-acetyltransferase n=1 Tax=Marinicauda salina TaxID=2135793 RepID=A0A2U2BR46_9PROT|nr:GNAT family N-acetyltransferase [Marinicauda salina]PWE16484.1 GNAT family N-acetyltransferase [Marinicauda salina]
MSDVRIRMIERLGEVSPGAWDAVANPPGAACDPFLSWAFLDALETSGSAVEEAGWGPRHLLAEDGDGKLVGALPLYLKGHSYGEYVFDHAWAHALERAGGAYYPKLLTAVPFTPATGRRLLSPEPEVRDLLAGAAMKVCAEWGVSGWHVLFPFEPEWARLGELGLLRRADIQFIWENDGYASYDDFLAALSSRKRKALRKERAAAQAGLEIVPLTGSDLTEEHWDVFFACYQDTGERKWGSPYLNREFFSLVHERMAEDVLLVMARRDGRWIAAALNFIGSEALFGRYWGCLEHQDNLHFELCYHRAVDFAIDRGLKRVEAGAQGPHKMARGYRPRPVYSAHYLTNPGLSDAVARFLEQERPAVESEIVELERDSPYKRG